VLQAACAQLQRWHQAGYTFLRMTINVSPQQFQMLASENLPSEAGLNLHKLVQKVLAETGLPAPSLELEITENLVRRHNEFDLATLHNLRALGIRIAIDDFGVGSSLSFLKHFPIDTLKIDQSFVQGITEDAGDAAFIKAIIAMAHSLKLKVVAEGVINKAQEAFLRDLNCDEVQGFLFSQPLPAEKISKLLQKQQAS
jgi:EAL domain-containing protein (putative c-di-GMP-specific phosphodiesterase class I)